MSVRRENICELIAKIAAGILLLADLLYMVLAGMNIAVLPAAYVEVEEWGSKVGAVFSVAIVVVLLIVDAVLVAALANRSRLRWFLLVDTLSVILLIGGTVYYSSEVTDCVIGMNALPAANAVLLPVLVIALVAAGALEWEREGGLFARLRRTPSSAAEPVLPFEPIEVADFDVVPDDGARPTGQRSRMRCLRAAHDRRVRRVRR